MASPRPASGPTGPSGLSERPTRRLSRLFRFLCVLSQLDPTRLALSPPLLAPAAPAPALVFRLERAAFLAALALAPPNSPPPDTALALLADMNRGGVPLSEASERGWPRPPSRPACTGNARRYANPPPLPRLPQTCRLSLLLLGGTDSAALAAERAAARARALSAVAAAAAAPDAPPSPSLSPSPPTRPSSSRPVPRRAHSGKGEALAGDDTGRSPGEGRCRLLDLLGVAMALAASVAPPSGGGGGVPGVPAPTTGAPAATAAAAVARARSDAPALGGDARASVARGSSSLPLPPIPVLDLVRSLASGGRRPDPAVVLALCRAHAATRGLPLEEDPSTDAPPEKIDSLRARSRAAAALVAAGRPAEAAAAVTALASDADARVAGPARAVAAWLLAAACWSEPRPETLLDPGGPLAELARRTKGSHAAPPFRAASLALVRPGSPASTAEAVADATTPLPAPFPATLGDLADLVDICLPRALGGAPGVSRGQGAGGGATDLERVATAALRLAARAGPAQQSPGIAAILTPLAMSRSAGRGMADPTWDVDSTWAGWDGQPTAERSLSLGGGLEDDDDSGNGDGDPASPSGRRLPLAPRRRRPAPGGSRPPRPPPMSIHHFPPTDNAADAVSTRAERVALSLFWGRGRPAADSAVWGLGLAALALSPGLNRLDEGSEIDVGGGQGGGAEASADAGPDNAARDAWGRPGGSIELQAADLVRGFASDRALFEAMGVATDDPPHPAGLGPADSSRVNAPPTPAAAEGSWEEFAARMDEIDDDDDGGWHAREWRWQPTPRAAPEGAGAEDDAAAGTERRPDRGTSQVPSMAPSYRDVFEELLMRRPRYRSAAVAARAPPPPGAPRPGPTGRDAARAARRAQRRGGALLAHARNALRDPAAAASRDRPLGLGAVGSLGHSYGEGIPIPLWWVIGSSPPGEGGAAAADMASDPSWNDDELRRDDPNPFRPLGAAPFTLEIGSSSDDPSEFDLGGTDDDQDDDNDDGDDGDGDDVNDSDNDDPGETSEQTSGMSEDEGTNEPSSDDTLVPDGAGGLELLPPRAEPAPGGGAGPPRTRPGGAAVRIPRVPAATPEAVARAVAGGDPLPEPPEAAVQQLMDVMGLSRTHAVEVLAQFGGSVEEVLENAFA